MKNNTKKTLSYYWQASKKYQKSGVLMLFSMLLVSLLEVISPLYYKKFFDLLSGATVAPKLMAELLSIIGIIALLSIGAWILRRLNNFLANYFESKVMADLNDFCFGRLHLHSFAFFNNNFVGSLTKKVKWFVNSFESIVDRLIWNILPLLVNIVFITIVLYRLNFWLGVALSIWLAVFIGINWAFTSFKLKYDIKRSELETASTGILADTITNNSAVKLFNGYKREVAAYAEANEKLRQARRWTWDLGAIFDGAQGFLAIALELGVMIYAVWLWRQGNFTLGSFVLVQTYLGSIMGRLWDFGNIIRRTYENLSDAEEMTVVLETPFEIADAPQARELKVSSGAIELQNVDFNYHQTRAIFKDFNLLIPARQRLAVIGPSGSGKTTLIKLLFRMHNLTAGKILIDDQDIAKVTQESLWRNVSLVPQDPILFHRTLKENIAYGRPGASDEEIMAAAQAANCHEFISALEKGYDTYVGERGVKLSGGERQRVAIARAILRNAPILVLDEATSSLDSQSEKLIQEALERLMKNKTVIVIAHRLSTIRRMDRIVVIKDGQIIEDGDHQSLLDKESGLYRDLWQLQAGGFLA